MPMLMTITLIISSLVVVNLLLLKFSTNKAVKVSKANKKPIILHSNRVTIDQEEEHLAPTGS